MRFGGSGWKPDSRRNRRAGRKSRSETEKGADRSFVVILVVFTIAVLALAVVFGMSLN